MRGKRGKRKRREGREEREEREEEGGRGERGERERGERERNSVHTGNKLKNVLPQPNDTPICVFFNNTTKNPLLSVCDCRHATPPTRTTHLQVIIYTRVQLLTATITFHMLSQILPPSSSSIPHHMYHRKY